jgi:hypothetical protein
MRRVLLGAAAAALFVGMMTVGVAVGGPSSYQSHLKPVGFDPLGEPGNGINSEIVVDTARGFAYVGAISFDPAEPDIAVKAVDISDPTNPTVTAAVFPIGGTVADGNFGPFDVKIAGNVLAASTQGLPEANSGITLMDISDPANPVPVSHLSGTTDLSSPFGSHNSFLWQDPLTGSVWLFATGLDLTSLKIFDVTNPASPVFVAEYNNGNADPFVHDNFVQENGGRVLEYQVGSIGVEILDVTRIVRGGESGMLTFADDVVAYNHYTSNPPGTPPVTRPMFAHYIEPTADGRVTWVGDEAGCGQPAIVRSMDTSSVPAPGAPKLQLAELGTIVDRPDAPMCQGLINSEKFVGQLQDYRWTGHNFDIWSNGLLIRGDYGRGVTVWDISDPTNPTKVAKSRALNRMVGEENKNDPGRDKELEHYPFVWQAIYDGDLIYASDIDQGLYILDLLGD